MRLFTLVVETKTSDDAAFFSRYGTKKLSSQTWSVGLSFEYLCPDILNKHLSDRIFLTGDRSCIDVPFNDVHFYILPGSNCQSNVGGGVYRLPQAGLTVLTYKSHKYSPSWHAEAS